MLIPYQVEKNDPSAQAADGEERSVTPDATQRSSSAQSADSSLRATAKCQPPAQPHSSVPLWPTLACSAAPAQERQERPPFFSAVAPHHGSAHQLLIRNVMIFTGLAGTQEVSDSRQN